MIYCKHKGRNVPYWMADSVCRRIYQEQAEAIRAVFTDFDYGEDRLDVMWSRIMQRMGLLDSLSPETGLPTLFRS